MTTGRRIGLIGAAVVLLLAVGAWLVLRAAGAGLSADGSGLARVELGRFGGSVEQAHVVTAHGKQVPLQRVGDVLTPTVQLTAGEREEVTVVVKRPGVVSWALGKTRTEHLSVRTPTAAVASRWIEARADGSVSVPFTGKVSHVTYLIAHQASERTLKAPNSSVAIPARSRAGTVSIAAAARPWLRVGKAAKVAWFPRASEPVALVSPKPNGLRGSAQPIRLTFSEPVDKALGSARPKLTPSTPGAWTKADSHTLLFTPTGYGTGFGTAVKLELPKAIDVADPDGSAMAKTREITWKSQPGSTTRLQQLLAQGGYLPVDWSADGTDVAKTRAAESIAASVAPKGTFSWRYSHTPKELRKQWTPGMVDAITRGAVMKFQSTHGLAVDAVAGADVWKALLDDAIAGKRIDDGYSYVYVHRDLPQKLTLWHNGKTVISSPGNTGIPSAPTELGTFPVFEHLPVTTMSGTNPDGSTYNDPGIKWVSYFNGGDALHTFNRASFGTPQSLGCVELPESTAKTVYPFTPIGTLVTIEH